MRDPFSGDFQCRLVLRTNVLTTTGWRIDDNNHFHRTLRPVAEPERIQTSDHIRLVETRNHNDNSEVRFRLRGDLPVAESKAAEIKLCFPSHQRVSFQSDFRRTVNSVVFWRKPFERVFCFSPCDQQERTSGRVACLKSLATLATFPFKPLFILNVGSPG